MNELAAYQSAGLPVRADDLAKFIVIAQEKLKAVKAEIRAIERLDMAKEVYEQKKGEQRTLQELTLLAYQRMGEITREMPAAPEGRPRKENCSSSETVFEKPKSQMIQELGFAKSQVCRMEQMAAHPEIVEEVIAESQAGRTEATQTEVLRRIREQKESNIVDLDWVRKTAFAQSQEQIDADAKIAKDFVRATHAPLMFSDDLDAVAAAIWRNADGDTRSDIEDIDLAIRVLNAIKMKLMNGRKLYGSA